SVAGDGRLVLGVNTDVFLGGDRLGEAATAEEAREMVARLAGRTHGVVSGLCLRGPVREELHRVVTAVTFRPVAAEEIAGYVESGGWEGRARACAVRGLA